jgi:hypothetical protein
MTSQKVMQPRLLAKLLLQTQAEYRIEHLSLRTKVQQDPFPLQPTVTSHLIDLSEFASCSQLFTILPERKNPKEASKRQTSEKTTSLPNAEIAEQGLREVNSSAGHSTAQEGYHDAISQDFLDEPKFTRTRSLLTIGSKETCSISWIAHGQIDKNRHGNLVNFNISTINSERANLH